MKRLLSLANPGVTVVGNPQGTKLSGAVARFPDKRKSLRANRTCSRLSECLMARAMLSRGLASSW
jgi:hypothetical protein